MVERPQWVEGGHYYLAERATACGGCTGRCSEWPAWALSRPSAPIAECPQWVGSRHRPTAERAPLPRLCREDQTVSWRPQAVGYRRPL